ncbi:MAG TPA: Gfo/Idh/MocA family oxidoreductase [Steroidobacteraceae bacterium]|jgi:predicted dehydrogenase|nr:Gfo/Idh/MocA family oxidoreductase [Steroidobacteraceae bacterium]
MIERTKVGIVGLGEVARIHLKAYRELQGIQIVGVADVNPARVEWARELLRVPGYPTLAELLRSHDLDVVCVLTPPATHEELVCACADAGVHVLCEKPLSLSVPSCERMIEACRTKGVRLGYGSSYRFLPALTTAREMILRGDIGEVLLLREYAVGGMASAERGTLGFEHYPKGGPGGSGMGLCDHGIHLIDVFPWLMNTETIAVSGRGNISGEPQRPEYAHMEYANGAMGQLLYEDGTFTTTLPTEGLFAWGGGWNVGGGKADAPAGAWNPDPGCILVHGSTGSLRIYHYSNILFHRSATGVRKVRLPDKPVPSNFAMQLEAFIEAIRSGLPTPVPGEVGLDAARTLLGVYAGTGVPVASSVRHAG